MSPIDSTQIALFGGVDQDGKHLEDVIIFNTETEEVSSPIEEGKAGP